jgi:hypothetical protein
MSKQQEVLFMDNETFEKVTVDTPLIIAAAVIEAAGYELLDTLDENAIVGFAIPHSFGGYCNGVVEFLPGVGLLQITTALIRGSVQPYLAAGLVHLLNRLNIMMPGVTFTYDRDVEGGDEIEISTWCFVFDEIQLEAHVKLMVRYLEEALKVSLPAIFHYVSQRLRFQANADGGITYVGPTYSVDQVLEMVELEQYGRA